MNIGIFGGAFDPFHIEHKNIIIKAYGELNLDCVIVIPSFCPPHKQFGMSSYESRREMVQKSVASLPFVVIDDIERRRGGLNPTHEILALMQQKYPQDNLFLIIGGDSMVNFHTWVKPQEICKIATLAVVARSGYTKVDDSIEQAKIDYDAKVTKLIYEGKEVSSSVIKASLELSMDTVNLGNEVRQVIKKRGLYKKFNGIVTKARRKMPRDTFKHCCNTVIYALKLNSQLNLPYDKVFTACLLHDCAKHIYKEMDGVPAKVVHQFEGVKVAKSVYEISDEEILDAINYHTTGKADMSKLAKLVFCADMLEKSRKYDGVNELREIIEQDFEQGFVQCVNRSVAKLTKENVPIHPLTKECYAYYNNIDTK